MKSHMPNACLLAFYHAVFLAQLIANLVTYNSEIKDKHAM